MYMYTQRLLCWWIHVQWVAQCAMYNSHLSSLDVSYIDTLIFIQWDGLAFGDYIHFHRGYILQGATDHPTVARHSVRSLYMYMFENVSIKLQM